MKTHSFLAAADTGSILGMGMWQGNCHLTEMIFKTFFISKSLLKYLTDPDRTKNQRTNGPVNAHLIS